MIKSITHFLIVFFIFQQLKSQISQIDQNGVNPFCDETLHYVFPFHHRGRACRPTVPLPMIIMCRSPPPPPPPPPLRAGAASRYVLTTLS